MKWIINEFEEWKDEDGDCSLRQDMGFGTAIFYEIVTDDYSDQYSIENNKSDAELILNELNKENK